MKSTSKTSILVVDDEPLVRELVERILTDEGYAVTLAKDGDDGLAAVQAQPFQLVIADLQMPGMDVLELLKKTKELGVPVIIFSGTGTRDKLEEALKTGIKDFLVKGSFNIPAFLERVKKALGKNK